MKLPLKSIIIGCSIAPMLLAVDNPDKSSPGTKPATVPATKPVLKIIPGQVIVPFDNMRRPWGELISVDLSTRTGKFRKDGTDEVISFTVMPYAELLHHAAFGDLQDFRTGERVIFRLHPNEAGEWVWLTYIQDEMNMMNGHKEYYYVDAIDARKGDLSVTQANFDKSFVREKGIVINTDADTHYWKSGQPAAFADIKVGDKLRTKTHGVGKGKTRVAWEVFLDDESLARFQAAQNETHQTRMQKEGLPGYVDAQAAGDLQLTLFQEGEVRSSKLKPGSTVWVAPAGSDRKPTAAAIEAKVSTIKKVGKSAKVTLSVSGPTDSFKPAGLAWVWVKTN